LIRRGLIEATLYVAGTAVLSMIAIVSVPHPSADLFEGLGAIGGAFLVAYAVTASWLIQTSTRRDSNRERWVGFVSGVGLCGLIGIAVALGFSQHAKAHQNLLDQLALAWCIASLAILGAIVALQPWMIYEWKRGGGAD
jgi:NhaP-type Na+/H+ or K+/H+ antiporter